MANRSPFKNQRGNLGLENVPVYDKRLSLGSVIAYGLWALVVLLLAASWGFDSAHLGRAALACSAAAATAHIRQFFVTQDRLLRNAFELGRDSAGGYISPVRPQRSRVTVR